MYLGFQSKYVLRTADLLHVSIYRPTRSIVKRKMCTVVIQISGERGMLMCLSETYFDKVYY